MRTIGDEPRNIEPWPSEETISEFPCHSNGGTERHDRFNAHQPPLYGGVLVRLKCAGHLAGMDEIFLAKPMGNRPRGRPLLILIDWVEKDLKILKVKFGKKVARFVESLKKNE
ncbi:hypothetical protein TNCV_2438951 [Trichonephila clavipes]|nr:hypothetical protein TNCV_2438951 [Trichonephila clavipes]